MDAANGGRENGEPRRPRGIEVAGVRYIAVEAPPPPAPAAPTPGGNRKARRAAEAEARRRR